MQQNSSTKEALKLGLGMGCSRVLGLARDILFAYILGTGWAADIFLAAFRLPNLARRLLQDGALSLSFIPVFRREHAHKSLDSAFSFGRTTALELGLGVVLLALLGVAGARGIAVIFLPGFAENSSLVGQAASLLRISFFYLPLAVLIAAGSGMLMALGRYAAPSASPVAFNIGLLCAGFYALAGGLGGYGAARALCMGLLLGGLCQLALHWIALKRQGFSPLGRLEFSSGANKAFLRALPFSLIGSTAFQLNVIIATLLASFLGEGAISALYYAERLIEMPVALIGVTLSTASLAGFSLLAIEERKEELSTELRRVLATGFFLTLPCAFGLVCFALPIIQGIFGRGAFDISAIALTSACLVCYAPALPAVAASRTLLAALNAWGKAGVTVGAALASLACMVGLAALLMPVLHVAGLALAGSAAAWVNCAFLYQALRRSGLRGEQSFMPWREIGLYSLMSLGMSAAALAFNAAALHFAWSNLLRLGLGIPGCMAIYFGLAVLARSPELAVLKRRYGASRQR